MVNVSENIVVPGRFIYLANQKKFEEAKDVLRKYPKYVKYFEELYIDRLSKEDLGIILKPAEHLEKYRKEFERNLDIVKSVKSEFRIT